MTEKPQPLDLDRLAVEVAKLSAEQDEDGSWWGFDTDIGDLPREIKDVIRRYLKSACEFFLRYMDNPDLLIDEHPEYERIIQNLKPIREHGIVIRDFYEIYNEWLFKLAFKSIFEDENEKE